MNRTFVITAISVTFVFCTSSPTAWAREKNPFSPLTEFVSNHKGWTFSHAEQAEIFNHIREELGENFESSLFTYAGVNLERIYWCGLFLVDEDYLQGREPLPHTALKLFEKGLSVPCNPASENREMMNTTANHITIKVTAAVLCSRMGLTNKAKQYKKEVEDLLKKYPIFEGAFPALGGDGFSIYDSL